MEIVKKPIHASAPPCIDQIEKTTVEMIGDRHRQEHAALQGSAEPVRTSRLQIFGTPALMINDSTLLVWRKDVPKELLQNTEDSPTTEWAYFVASVKLGAPTPSFRVLSVHGKIDSAIQEFVAEAAGLLLAA